MTDQGPAASASADRLARLRAWAIHILTATGALAGLMSLVEIFAGNAPMALIWLGVSMIIDALDGPLARRYRIAEVLPRVDGAVLDLVIDYATYTLIPAVFLYRFELVPEGLNIATAGFVLFTSLYCFANRDMKTRDNFFSGFPATWNLVVLYFFLLDSPAWVNLVVVLGLGVLTFVPVTFVHPFRVVMLRRLTMTMTVIWGGLALYLVLASREAVDLENSNPLAFWAFVAISFYFAGISAWRSIHGEASP